MNRFSLVSVATAAILALASPAFAQSTTASAPAATTAAAPATSTAPAATPMATAQAQPDANEVVCETQAPPTGTLLGGTRICRTRRQWKEQEDQTQVGQDLHRMTSGGMPVN
jgi:invasion protein IalB